MQVFKGKIGLRAAGLCIAFLGVIAVSKQAASNVPVSIDALLGFEKSAVPQSKPEQARDPAPLPSAKPHVVFGGAPTPDRKPLRQQKMVSLGPLNPDEIKLYKEIFTLQTIGQMGKADDKINQLNNGLLMGHVLAQRYMHPTAYTSRYRELKSWLDQYRDYPQAEKIYKLALKKGPGSSKGLKKPRANKNRQLRAMYADHEDAKVYKPKYRRSRAQQRDVVALFQTIRKKIARERPTQALGVLEKHRGVKYIDKAEYDQLRAMIASGYLYAGKLSKAEDIASAAYKRSAHKAPLAGWVMGLLHWRTEDYAEAAEYFETAAKSPYASGWMVSAAAYWGSRSHMRAGNVRDVSRLLTKAASYPRTFYGLLATRALGQNFNFDWKRPHLQESKVKDVESSKVGMRARALMDIGYTHLAEEELQHAFGRDHDLLLAYALENNLPSLSIRLSSVVTKSHGERYDAAAYPVMPWEPEGGYKIDRALIHAFIRQESRFNSQAANPSGATGLMQVMPTTASYVTGKRKYRARGGQYQLKDPQINLEIGQRYIEKLMSHNAVKYDLLSLAIAYNAGPGNLRKWKRRKSFTKDPLLFIETIPYAETRAFVERVLANYWIYRMRFDQGTPSMDDVAQGRWARYAGMKDQPVYSNKPVKFAYNQ